MSLISWRVYNVITTLLFSTAVLVTLFGIGYVCFISFGMWALISLPDDLYGYVDNRGHFVIPPKYVDPGDFKNGRAKVFIYRENSCSAILSVDIDKQGKVFAVHEPSCTHSRFPEGYTPSEGDNSKEYPKAVSSEGWYGYQNKDGSWLLTPQFAKAGQFHNGVAWVQAQNDNDEHWLWGLINRKGEYVLKPKCQSAGDFHEGLAYCRVPVYFGMFY